MAKTRRSNGSLFKKKGRGSWIACWYDHTGKRREHSTRTTDRASAERILAKLVAEAALRRDGVIDPKADRFAIEGRRKLRDHIEAYITHCQHAGQATKNIANKKHHLFGLLETMPGAILAELDADTLERYLAQLKMQDRAARTINMVRQNAVAFYSWCCKTGRAQSNPLSMVPKQDEQRDRRRVRRPLTDAELARLLQVAQERGRDAWYLAAALAGLRKGDLQRLTWADIDFDRATLTISDGKAKRTDIIPMHPQLAQALHKRFSQYPAMPKARVFPQTVTDRTRLKDFLRAGLAREETITDAQGRPVMVGSGSRQRPKTRITTEDDQGRVIDLHALRTTLGTQLARNGVAPQIAMRIMRHSDYKTTLAHYTVLGLTDTSRAIEALPEIHTDSPHTQRATGTSHAQPLDDARQTAQKHRQRACQQPERQTGHIGAPRRD